jgi:hypothetical protein
MGFCHFQQVSETPGHGIAITTEIAIVSLGDTEDFGDVSGLGGFFA